MHLSLKFSICFSVLRRCTLFVLHKEAYLELCQTTIMEPYVKIING